MCSNLLPVCFIAIITAAYKNPKSVLVFKYYVQSVYISTIFMIQIRLINSTRQTRDELKTGSQADNILNSAIFFLIHVTSH